MTQHEQSRPRFSQLPPTPESSRFGVVLRRFAGHVDHIDQLAHVRVVHLTDQHVGRVTPMEVQRGAVDAANAQQPDLIAITGDFVCHSQAYLEQLTEVVRGFQAPVVCVLGNHDHWSGAQAVRHTLQRAGALVLDNAFTELSLRGQRLQVVGVDDAYTDHADVRAATRGLRHDLPSIGLSHIAEEADRLWAAGVPLVLSGHTHGGQVTLARMNEMLLGHVMGHKYVHGLYGCRGRKRGPLGAVYVGAGIGASVVPLRLGERAKREVAVFELGAEAGAFEEHHSEQRHLPGRKPSAATRERRRRQLERRRKRHPPLPP